MNINDRVDQISTTIQELRQAAADGRRSRQLLDSLFRTVHSLKAAAAAEGLTDVSHTAHEFENVLHSLRTGQLILDTELLSVFEDAVTALRENAPASALNTFKERTGTHITDTYEGLPAEFANLKAEERQRAIAALREGAHLYVMNVEFGVGDFDAGFRKLKEELEKNAELISTSPRMENDKIIFQVAYASDSEKIPFRTVLQQALRAGNSAAAQLGKQVNFVISSEEFLLDKRWADALADALVHLVRNALDHGIESRGTVVIEAEQTKVTVTDNGRGIAPEQPGRAPQPGRIAAARRGA